MKEDILKENRTVLMLGIGGVSMHQLALCYLKDGYKVMGYDRTKNEYTVDCEKHGIVVFDKFNKIGLNVDFCVKTAAVKDDNKFVVELKKRGIKIVDRAEALGYFAVKFKCVVAVAGTHGKSTTSALIYEMLRQANMSVSCHIGADVFAPRFNTDDDVLVVEACEYNKSFLSLYPTISVVTNVEPEHLDCYGSFYALKTAFATFLRRGKKRFVFKGKTTEFLRKINDVNFVEKKQNMQTKLLGEYNQKNIALASAVARSFGVSEQVIERVVKNFSGLPRRYEYIGDFNRTKCYIDYAHHPTEVGEFVTTFLEQNKGALIVFQPHTFSRTKNLLPEFLSVLRAVKDICIFKEYSAREEKSSGMSAYELYLKVKEINKNVRYCATTKNVIKQMAGYRAVAFVGAGNINLVAKNIVKTN